MIFLKVLLKLIQWALFVVLYVPLWIVQTVALSPYRARKVHNLQAQIAGLEDQLTQARTARDGYREQVKSQSSRIEDLGFYVDQFEARSLFLLLYLATGQWDKQLEHWVPYWWLDLPLLTPNTLGDVQEYIYAHTNWDGLYSLLPVAPGNFVQQDESTELLPQPVLQVSDDEWERMSRSEIKELFNGP